MANLNEKTAVVTGGGTGIGQAIAIELAACGAKVIVVGRRQAALDDTVNTIEATGGSARSMTCDLSDAAAIAALGESLEAASGGVDVLINNAGSNSNIRSTRYIEAEEWRTVMDVNTLGPAMLTRALIAGMIARGSGDVVMVSSMAALRPGVMAGAAYSAAKSASRAYMDVLSQEVRSHGIRCITVCPGEVNTAILDDRPLPPNADIRSELMQPEDVAKAVALTLQLPRRANVTELVIDTAVPRDLTRDIAAAKEKGASY